MTYALVGAIALTSILSWEALKFIALDLLASRHPAPPQVVTPALPQSIVVAAARRKRL
jgi:hypothetical protein